MKVFWTSQAETRFFEIQKYIVEEFGAVSKDMFNQKVLKFVDLLSVFPNLGNLEVPEKNIFGFQLTKQTRIFYRVFEEYISLLTFFDSRQNPDGKPK